MLKMLAPKYSILAPELVKSYAPPEDRIFVWHTVRSGYTDTLASIAKQYSVPVEKLIEFNFPGSVISGRVDPGIVNWYLFNHLRMRCRHVTRDGHNYMFKGGEKIAIPYLGRVDVGEPVFLVPTNTQFKIKQHANLNVSMIVAADFSIFQIWDQESAKCSYYTFWAAGVSKSVTPGFLSGTLAGPWNDLVVNKAIAVNQFTGAARFTTGGGGSKTLNYLNLMGLPPGTETVPNPLPLNTGFTMGIGGGTSVGEMKLELCGTSDGLLPFNPPAE